MMSEERKARVMPEWMEQYRDLVINTGGNTVEELMNDTTTTPFNNHIRNGLVISVQSQVAMLEALHKYNELSSVQFETPTSQLAETSADNAALVASLNQLCELCRRTFPSCTARMGLTNCDTHIILSQPHPGTALLEELEMYRDGSHPNLVMREETKCKSCLAKPIEFTEADGTVRRLVYEEGDDSVGIFPGWFTDDDVYDNLQTEVERLRGALEALASHCEAESLFVPMRLALQVRQALNPPQKDGEV